MPEHDNISSAAESAKPRKHDARNYEARLRAAGIDPQAPPPENIDEFRCQFARRIAMFVNEWHGCPETLCQRNRGCMAPQNRCSNRPPRSREEADRAWREVQSVFVKKLQAHLAKLGMDDE